MYKNKNFCIRNFSKNLTFLTNLAINLNFVCQICNFLQPKIAQICALFLLLAVFGTLENSTFIKKSRPALSQAAKNFYLDF